jgi:DNA-binding transcriptional regulator LsrR (DeoR family)
LIEIADTLSVKFDSDCRAPRRLFVTDQQVAQTSRPIAVASEPTKNEQIRAALLKRRPTR